MLEETLNFFFLSGWVGGGISEYSGCMGTGVLTSEASNVWGKKIRTHISEFGVSTAVPGCSWMCKPSSPYLSALPVFIQFWHCLFPENVRVVLKVKLTNIIRQQPYDLNLLIRSMDGEVSPQFNKWSSFLGVTFQFPYKEVLPKIVSFSQSASPV